MEVIDWNEENLPVSNWEISIKIDGVRCHNINNKKLSRKNKPLYNIPDFNGDVAEIFCSDFDTTMSNTSTFKIKKEIKPEEVFILRPNIDPRLHLITFINSSLSIETIWYWYYYARSKGFEGIVIRDLINDISYRKKPVITEDIKIIDYTEGTGENIGKLRSFITTKGKVGSGISKKIRIEYFNDSIIGKTIEVRAMEYTKSGKFRQARFIRFRPDKD